MIPLIFNIKYLEYFYWKTQKLVVGKDSRRGKWGVVLNGYKALVVPDEKVVETNYTTMWMYLMLLNGIFKNIVLIVNFMLCSLLQFLKITYIQNFKKHLNGRL